MNDHDRVAIAEGDATEANCPQCGKAYADYDGFGVVACLKPDGCGYCRHLSASLVATADGAVSVCGICEAVIATFIEGADEPR